MIPGVGGVRAGGSTDESWQVVGDCWVSATKVHDSWDVTRASTHDSTQAKNLRGGPGRDGPGACEANRCQRLGLEDGLRRAAYTRLEDGLRRTVNARLVYGSVVRLRRLRVEDCFVVRRTRASCGCSRLTQTVIGQLTPRIRWPMGPSGCFRQG